MQVEGIVWKVATTESIDMAEIERVLAGSAPEMNEDAALLHRIDLDDNGTTIIFSAGEDHARRFADALCRSKSEAPNITTVDLREKRALPQR